MAKVKGYEFTVTGIGSFPIDMLRYDRAWPARGEDAAKFPFIASQAGTESRTITLRSLNEPTAGRWHSFRWTVGNVKKIDINA